MLNSKLLKAIPLDHLRELATHLLQAGLPVDEVVDEVVAVADDLVDWTKILPPPWGATLDKYDGPILSTLVRLVVHQLAHDRS